MLNVQLFWTIGIPSILAILAWLPNTTRHSSLEASLDERIDGVVGRVDKLSARVDAQADSHHRDRLRIMQALTGLHERVAVVESKQP